MEKKGFTIYTETIWYACNNAFSLYLFLKDPNKVAIEIMLLLILPRINLTADMMILGGISLQRFEFFTHLFLRGIHSERDGVLTAPSVVHEHSTEGR